MRQDLLKQKQIKDEVDASLQIKIKKQNELILDLRSKIKDAKNYKNIEIINKSVQNIIEDFYTFLDSRDNSEWMIFCFISSVQSNGLK